MTTLFLLRHGNTFFEGEKAYQIGKKTDLPLTPVGQEQAHRFARYLKHRSFTPDSIYCGTLKRQKETASILLEHFPESQLHSEECALDEIDYGVWEGLSPDTIQSRWEQAYTSWKTHGVWPKDLFESDKETCFFHLHAWLNTIKASRDETIIAISSHAILRLLLCETLRLRPFSSSQIKTGHFGEIKMQEEKAILHSWNKLPFL